MSNSIKQGTEKTVEAVNEVRTCPFDDPSFEMDPDMPCPVCGDLGIFSLDNNPVNCVSRI